MAATATASDAPNTRERILDVALDLFVEQGYDATSLRQIADVMGFTKAALYYHFASKDDLLFALHLRLHAISHRAIENLGQAPLTPATWSEMLMGMLDELLVNRKLFLLHQRDPKAITRIQAKHDEHEDEHEDMGEILRTMLRDPAVPLKVRVRLGAAVGTVFAALGMLGEDDDLRLEDLAAELRSVIADVLAPVTDTPRG